MPVVTFACPECGKVLKSARAIPAGKKIKCPHCAAVFPTPAPEDDETAAAVSDKRRPSAPAAPRRDDDDDDTAPPRRKARRGGDEDEDEDRPRARRAAKEDEDEEDDRPRRKTKQRKGPTRRRSGGSVLWIAVAAVLLLLLLGGGGVGVYFLWFGNVNRGGGNEDPLALVPPGTEAISGFDFLALMSDPTFGPRLEKALREQNGAGDFFETCKKETGLEYKELFARTVVAGSLDTLTDDGRNAGGLGAPMPIQRGGPALARPKAMTLILRPSRPFDQKKIAKSCKDPVHKKAHGKHYYEVHDGDFRTLFMPSDRTIVLSTRPAAELDALFASDGTTPSVSADAVALVRGVEKSAYWVVVPFEGSTRARVQDGLRQVPPLPALQALTDPVARSKGVAVWAGMEGDQVKIGVNVACADAAAATQVVQAVEKAWAEQKLQVAGVGLMLSLNGMPKTGKAFSELTGSLKFTAEATMARASAGMGRTTLAEVVQEMEKAQQQQGGPAGGFNPPGGVPPGPVKK